MSTSVETVKISPFKEDCVLEVMEKDTNQEIKAQRKYKCEFINITCGCVTQVFIWTAVATIVAIILGGLLYSGFHGHDTPIDFGVAITYGYAALLLMFITLSVLLCICCPRCGQTKIKALGIR